MNSLKPLIRISLFLLTVILFVYGIIAAKQFLFPLALAAMFAYLLFPIANYLEKHRVPRILAILISIAFALVIIGIVFFLFYRQLTKMFADFDTLKERANNNIELLQHNLETMLGLQDNRIEEFLKTQVNRFFQSENGGFTEAFSTTTGTLLKLILLPIYVFLFLYYRTKFAYFILKIVRKENKPVTIKILRDISTVAARYMGGVSIVVLILCVLNSVGLLIIGVDYAILLGIVSAFFNFIPYFGTLMGGSVPMLFVLLTTSDPLHYGLYVLILYIIVQVTENNILTPNIVGGNVKINPFFIILGLMTGAMIWGIPGMLVIVPFLAIMRIIFYHVEKTRPYAFLLGPRGTQKHSITLNKIRNALNFRERIKKSRDQKQD